MIDSTNQERYARERREQTDRRREEILDAAQALFLRKGLENVSMKEIAEEACISKMTLYRYFSGRDPIAFEIAVRMLKEVYLSISEHQKPEGVIDALIIAVRQFHAHEQAYRYLGMFDHLYAQNYPSEELAQWYKTRLDILDKAYKVPQSKSSAFSMMLGNATMSFLEKLAARGGLLEKEQGVSIDEQLSAYISMLEQMRNEPAAMDR